MDFRKICFGCMREKPQETGPCPYCGFVNEEYEWNPDHLRPLTPLNGKYLVGRVIGQGGFGITYIAFDLNLQIVVAIKELFLKRLSSRDDNQGVYTSARYRKCFEENNRRFLQEARVLAMFNEQDNEGVVIVKEQFSENNTSYIVMEYLDGQNLKDMIKQGPLSFEETMDLFEPVCHALIKIHQFDVIHLDVSPDNIMIQENGRAKLLDFGGSKTMGELEADSSGIITYKKGYAAPEQYMENGRTGPWTDVYATAATMYYCLAGQRPVDAMERKSGAELEKLSKFGVKIPAASEKVIRKAMELEPDQRYQSMEEFWDALSSKKPKKKKKKGKALDIILGLAALVIVGVSSYVLLADNNVIPWFTERATKYKEGDVMTVTPGRYIFENALDRSAIMGITDSLGDDGAELILTYYAEKNANRLEICSEFGQDQIYNIKAVHTSSYIQCSDVNTPGTDIVQNSFLANPEAGEWRFVYCGYDEETQMGCIIIMNDEGYVLAPENGSTESGTRIVLKEYDLEDDSQKWYMHWSEKDESEKPVVVHAGGDLVEDIEGVYDVSSAMDGKTSMCMSWDTTYNPEPTVVLYYAEWLSTNDTYFEFEFVPTGSESRYHIYPAEQEGDEKLCLEYDEETGKIVARPEEENNKNQLFRLVYAGSNNYLIQTYNESVIGFDLNADGTAEGTPVLSRPYDELEDSRLESWRIVVPYEA